MPTKETDGMGGYDIRIGDRVKRAIDGKPLDPRHPSAWKCWGVVRGIVDGCLVVKRWYPIKRWHRYLIVEPLELKMGMYAVKAKRR